MEGGGRRDEDDTAVKEGESEGGGDEIEEEDRAESVRISRERESEMEGVGGCLWGLGTFHFHFPLPRRVDTFRQHSYPQADGWDQPGNNVEGIWQDGRIGGGGWGGGVPDVLPSFPFEVF